jgi:hypothetical protein
VDLAAFRRFDVNEQQLPAEFGRYRQAENIASANHAT